MVLAVALVSGLLSPQEAFGWSKSVQKDVAWTPNYYSAKEFVGWTFGSAEVGCDYGLKVNCYYKNPYGYQTRLSGTTPVWQSSVALTMGFAVVTGSVTVGWPSLRLVGKTCTHEFLSLPYTPYVSVGFSGKACLASSLLTAWPTAYTVVGAANLAGHWAPGPALKVY